MWISWLIGASSVGNVGKMCVYLREIPLVISSRHEKLASSQRVKRDFLFQLPSTISTRVNKFRTEQRREHELPQGAMEHQGPEVNMESLKRLRVSRAMEVYVVFKDSVEK